MGEVLLHCHGRFVIAPQLVRDDEGNVSLDVLFFDGTGLEHSWVLLVAVVVVVANGVVVLVVVVMLAQT